LLRGHAGHPTAELSREKILTEVTKRAIAVVVSRDEYAS
jgi:hypothetical protein